MCENEIFNLLLIILLLSNEKCDDRCDDRCGDRRDDNCRSGTFGNLNEIIIISLLLNSCNANSGCCQNDSNRQATSAAARGTLCSPSGTTF